MERKAGFFQMKVRLKSEVRISWIKNGMVNNGKRILLPMEEILHHLGCIRLISRRNIPFLCIIERKESALVIWHTKQGVYRKKILPDCRDDPMGGYADNG